MGNKWEKFCLLMWKNFILQWRHPVQTLVEIAAPIVFTLLLVVFRSLVSPETYPASFFLPFETKLDNISSMRSTIMWSPVNPYLNKIMDETVKGINDVHGVTFFTHLGFSNSSDLNNKLSIGARLSLFAAVVFDDRFAGDVELKRNLSFILRFPGEVDMFTGWKTDEIFPVYYIPGVRSPELNNGGLPSYHDEGFLMLQEQLSWSIINHHKKTINGTSFNRTSAPIFMQRLPYPKYTSDVLLSSLDVFIGLIFMVSFVYTCINTVKVITTEKERQLKEAMKIMGLPNWLHWAAWFTKSFIMILISILIMVVLMKTAWYPGTDHMIFTQSNYVILLIFLILFGCSLITFTFAISALFSKANTAATFAGVAWFILYAPFMAFQYKYDSLSRAVKLLSSLCSNSALAFGLKIIVKSENVDEGLQWYNIWSPVQDDNLPFGHILIMLLVDAILYFLIAVYVELIYPGDYGIPQPWYFPFLPSFWCGASSNDIYGDGKQEVLGNNHEKEPVHLQPGVQIKNLRKVYSNKKEAVRGLSLNMYKDQITVLLGHNGAGKTTVMSMLTGMIPPTSGTATVGGFDIRTNIKGVRNSLGICPQHNILFDDLTVEEHLYFYSKLKGVNKNQVDEEIQRYVQLLELTQKAKSQSSELSGGMKRKLSVGVALCGNSQVVMCDEPTAGMDPSARRALWDLLLSQKKGRTILLTTHFMDEADLLGDRIAIMAGGKLECSGSSFFLKKRYGAGYHLILDKAPDCNIASITETLQKYIPTITVTNNVGSELTYVLSEEYNHVLENMLSELEGKSESLGVRSYGISLTTLEEVFMKVGADRGQEELNSATKTIDHSALDMSKHISEIKDQNAKLLEGYALWFNQFAAMLTKRALSILRSWLLLIFQILIPIVFLIITVIIMTNVSNPNNQPMIRIRLNRYIDPITSISRYVNNSYSQSFVNMLVHNNYTVQNWGNITESEYEKKMIEESETNIMTYNTRRITGASFRKDNSIVAWFSNQPYHGPPLALELVMNAILQSEVTPNHSITVYNAPLPYTINTQFSLLFEDYTMNFQIAYMLGLSMAFVSAFYIMFYIRERSTKFKHLQFVSGVNVLSFWIPSILCDILTFIITTLGIIITLAILQKDGLSTPAELSRIFTLLLIFGFATLPIAYLTSFLFDVPTTGYARLSLLNIVFGTATFTVVEVLSLKDFDLKDIADTLHQIFLIIPHYALSSGLRNMNVMHASQKLCATTTKMCIELKPIPSLPNMTIPPCLCDILICSQFTECCEEINFFGLETPGTGKNILYSCLVGILGFTILLSTEYGIFEMIRNTFQSKKVTSNDLVKLADDEDVRRENKTITYDVSVGNTQKYNLVMCNLSKKYKNFTAVDDVSIGIKKKECFGLLGVNGAGKTTTFKMATGDIKMSSGDVWVDGWSITKHLKKVYRLIGYCPQFDALLEDFTGRETLKIFGLLHGIRRSECNEVAERLAQEFDFYQHLDKKVKELSGGNKRKLSTALALVGDPLVLYLDEPTAGVDPATKRYLWNALCKIREKEKTIVLTSHSMEECEALCTRMAIMVNGSIKCIGSTQHLKSKFSDGYTLTIKVKQCENDEVQQAAITEIQTFVKQNFTKSILREQHQELLTFYITDKSYPWSKMFGIMERAKNGLGIADYSLGQCTLEQVFLSFAKYQRGE